MNKFKSSKASLFSTNERNFEANALSLFKFQAKNNPIYAEYIHHLGINIDRIDTIYKIPFLPIEFFKTQTIMTSVWEPAAIFESSGTTGQQRSKHYIHDINYYHQVAEGIFNRFYGELKDYHILALLPSYMERKNSSLVVMVRQFIKACGSPYAGFFLYDLEELISTLRKAQQNTKQIILIGVSFALLELAEQYDIDLRDVIVMETGGMKGKRAELTRKELHHQLKSSFQVEHIHSEYGMTELLSQAYAKSNGRFETPPWMKVIVRNTNDPFDMQDQSISGGVNIIDLANVQSCAFVETQDLGRVGPANTFEILGRFDNSDIRGCNLMVL